ncbi:hypothetical protein ACFU93_27060 [Streptomyces sp. NPDC057611]|uniref:hypothetical protein n=1 Tax=Streptomyces sp. NPDC057611 TaxID=3346182 RepID=UPI003689D6E9
MPLPELRVRSWTTETNSGTTWTQTASKVTRRRSPAALGGGQFKPLAGELRI